MAYLFSNVSTKNYWSRTTIISRVTVVSRV